MPLDKSGSKKAFVSNLKTELKAGKPRDQSLAIAYSVKRHGKKHMAKGGMAHTHTEACYGEGGVIKCSQGETNTVNQEPGIPAPKMPPHDPSERDYMAGMFSNGGQITKVEDAEVLKRKPDDYQEPKSEFMSSKMPSGEESEGREHYPAPPMSEYDSGYAAGKMAAGGMAMSPAERIMHRKRMATGGQVDLEKNSEEGGQSPYDNMNADGTGEQYDDSQLSAQPTDSNEHGDTLSDEDQRDQSLIDKIRERMKSRRGF